MDNLASLLKTFNLSSTQIQAFLSQLTCRSLKKYEHFQQQDFYCKYMGYVDSGKFRYYRVGNDGTEHTLWFNLSFNFIGDYHSFLKKTNAELSIQAMCDCEIILFSYDQLMKLYGFNADTQQFRLSMAERSMFGWREIALAFYCDTPEERYLKLLEKYPDAEQLIPVKYIASSLGITPETLSRIRTRLNIRKISSTL